ncbi:MAG: carboxymuconolactone decarboxylase family protein, partial [Acidobacteriota bacterium]
MKRFCLVALAAVSILLSGLPGSQAQSANNSKLATIAELTEQAKQRVTAKVRVALPTEWLESPKSNDSFEPAGSGRTPNYLLALASIPNAPKSFGQLFKTFVYGGTIAPETKAAMGLRVAQVNGSPYVAAHTIRLLRESARGSELLNALRDGKLTALKPAEQRALNYAELLTRDVLGITDAEFQNTGAIYNDAQMVELTMVVCFFNYFTRYAEA